MKLEYTVDLSTSGINKLIGVLGGYKRWLNQKSDELAKRLADMGAVRAEINFDAAYYDGDEDHHIEVIPVGKMQYKVRASGTTVLFVEFGSGLIGYGYDAAEINNMGPGTYPGKGLWNRPSGWYYTGSDGESHHSHGNPPNAPMYESVKELEAEFTRLVQEVFK